MKVCMVAYTFFEIDNRVKRYAEALAKRGDDVEVICLRKNDQPATGFSNGVYLHRIQKRTVNEKHKMAYLFKLLLFFVKSTLILSWRCLKNPYQLIHIHSVPDFEIFSALIPKMRGAKVILDIHDIVPEFYASKFNVDRSSFIFKMLLLIEKLSAGFADHILISNCIWRETFIGRSAKGEKCSVFLNYPDTSIFQIRPRTRNDGRFLMMYPGTLNWHQGLDIAVKAFHRISNQIPHAEFHIYGEGKEKEPLNELIAELNLKDRVFIKDTIPMEQIASAMSEADVGIVPKRNDSFGGEAFSTKILEFMALGIPVIVSRTKIDAKYFNPQIVEFFSPEEDDELGKSMLLLEGNKHLRETLASNALRYVRGLTWDKRKHEYFEIVDRLVGKTPALAKVGISSCDNT